MQRLEVSGAVRPIYGSLGVKRLSNYDIRYIFDYSVRFVHAVHDAGEGPTL